MRKLNLFFSAIAIALPLISWAQPRAAACFFSEDFEDASDLEAWDNTEVERRSPEGEGLGEMVPAWTLGNASQANIAQYFPVVDQPFGNRFAMANDAAPPCNCDMADVMLTSPVIDLSGHSNVVLECRVVNEGILGAGAASIEANVEGDTWVNVAGIAQMADVWQHLSVDLSAFDGAAALRFRFRWSDGGNWAGGFAVDDVCLRDRLTNDLTVSEVFAGDATVSPFVTSDQTLRYRQLPLEVATPLHVSVAVKNSGTAVLRNIVANATLVLNGNGHGPFTSTLIDSLAPGAAAFAVISTDWTPNEAGMVHIGASATSNTADDDSDDNTSAGALELTTTGWDGRYSAMACDFGEAIGGVGRSGTFMVANRMEIPTAGSHAFGISVGFNPSTEVGTVVRALIMDGNFSFIDTSLRRTISQADIDDIWNGIPLYFSLSNDPELVPGDVWVGLQRLGEGGNVAVNVGGDVPLGHSVLLEGVGSTLSYLYSAPMVRLHLSEVAVGVPEKPATADEIHVFPVPANDVVRVALPASMSKVEQWSIVDAMGRVVRTSLGSLQPNAESFAVDVSDLVCGAYTLTISGSSQRHSARLVVAR